MFYLHSKDPPLLFIRVPKNAGTSIFNSIVGSFTGGGNKLSVYRIKKYQYMSDFSYHDFMTDQEWESAFKFAVVRNPWDRVVSIWQHQRSHKTNRRLRRLGVAENKIIVTKAKLRENDFHWWLSTFAKKLGWRPVHFFATAEKSRLFSVLAKYEMENGYPPPQCAWFVRDGEIIVDKVYRFEGLAELESDLSITLDHINASDHHHYRKHHTGETAEWVAKVFAEDINRFGYTF